MAAPLYVLDTGVLMALINGKELGQRIDKAYGLRASPNRPLVCIVTHGELRAMAEANGFAENKREAIRSMLEQVVTVDISDEAVLRAYAEVYAALRRHPKGSRTNMGENDMWIAACTRALNVTLLTLDADFDALGPALIKHHRISRNLDA